MTLQKNMIAIVLAFAWLQIKASLGNRNSKAIDTICSKIITTPNNETEPLLIKASEYTNFYVDLGDKFEDMYIKNGECETRSHLKWKPCNINKGYVNISMKEAPKIDQLTVIGSNYECAINFVPKCDFKPAREATPILEVSFPFIIYALGMKSVRDNFSLKGTVSSVFSHLDRNKKRLCQWNGSTLESESRGQKCGNLTVNTLRNSLDYTHEYHRDNAEDITTFLFSTNSKMLGITVDWTKNGTSPDVTECEKYFVKSTTTETTAVVTTSSCSPVGSIFPILFGITLWIFE
nr:hypothetical transcript [Hymenolepis microstoma]